VWLPGDAESASLVPLPLADVEARKVSHHGSRGSGPTVLLHRLRPQVAGIGAREGNAYGHPTPQTLAVLYRAHAARTDRDRRLPYGPRPAGWRLETEK